MREFPETLHTCRIFLFISFTLKTRLLLFVMYLDKYTYNLHIHLSFYATHLKNKDVLLAKTLHEKEKNKLENGSISKSRDKWKPKASGIFSLPCASATHHSITWKEAIYQTKEILVHSQQHSMGVAYVVLLSSQAALATNNSLRGEIF